MTKHNWQEHLNKLESTVEANGKFASAAAIARFLGIPVTTVKGAIERDVFARERFIAEHGHQNTVEDGKPVKTKISGNTAHVKYAGGEPISEKELMQVAGLSPDDWKITDVDTTAWQIGRKGKRVELKWDYGKASGFVSDTGKIHKEYLFRMNLKLTRVNRVAVKAVLKPIELVVDNPLPKGDFVDQDVAPMRSTLFICDPHFGFTRATNGKLTPFHDRQFIGGLLSLAEHMRPDVIVWNGDALDLPDMSTFKSDPAILFNTQNAAIELAWVLAQFARHPYRQVYLEGNHEERLNRILKANFAAAFNLKPIHDLQGSPMLSVPRLLNLDAIDTEYIDGYPDNFVQMGKAIFEHGSVVRAGSGKTVAYEMPDATVSRFFGHIHRFELASKTLKDTGQTVWVGSPGCACVKGQVPGSKRSSNWQTGAFWVTLDPATGDVAAVEHISKIGTGESAGALFRGQKFIHKYFIDFLGSLDQESGLPFIYSPQT